MSEPDSTRSTLLFVAVITGALALAGVVWALDAWFDHALREELADKTLRRESPQLRALRVDEAVRLGRTQWIDRASGRLCIPVDRAMELVLAEWDRRPDGFVAPAGEAGPLAPAAGGGR